MTFAALDFRSMQDAQVDWLDDHPEAALIEHQWIQRKLLHIATLALGGLVALTLAPVAGAVLVVARTTAMNTFDLLMTATEMETNNHA